MRRELWVCLLLSLTTLAVYWQIGHHEFLNYDDTVYVSANADVMQGLSARSIAWAFNDTTQANWHPLTWLSHMLDWQLFGPNPRGHHLVNLAFHLANVLLLLALLQRTTGAFWKSAF